MPAQRAKPVRLDLSVQFTSLRFDHYKGLRDAIVPCEPGLNILVGNNNAGKSTALSTLRMLEPTLRLAASRAPAPFRLASTTRVGWRISEDGLPVSLENVHTDLMDIDSAVSVTTNDGSSLHLRFPSGGGAYLEAEPNKGKANNPAGFRKAFPIELRVCPVIGPLEHDEQLVQPETVRRGRGTHRASRHFRNSWHHFPEGFARFATLVSETWPGAKLTPPEASFGADGVVLHMFVEEDRRPRELYWSGFGFQIWCQLLAHASRVPEGGVFVVDEPETYLHPQLQRHFLEVLRSLRAQVFIATHSATIVASARPGEVLVVDRRAGSVMQPAETGLALARRLGMLPT